MKKIFQVSVFVLGLGISNSAFALTDDQAAQCDQTLFADTLGKVGMFLQANQPFQYAFNSDIHNKLESLTAKAANCQDLAKSMATWSDTFVGAANGLLNTLKLD